MTGQETAIAWGLSAASFAEIPEPHRIFLRSEIVRLYPLLPDDLRVRLGKDFSDFAPRVDRVLGLIPKPLERCEQPDTHLVASAPCKDHLQAKE